MIVALTDDLMTGSRISAVLEAAGYPVRIVGDAAALRATVAADSNVRAVLLPFAARTFDGIGVVRALRADTHTAHLPILAFGPHVDGTARAAARSAGATRVVTNGVFFTRMPAIVAALLAGAPDAGEDDG